MKMKSLLSLLLVMGIAVSFAQPERDAARRDAEALYKKEDALINAGKMNAFMNLFTEDFRYVDQQGKRMNRNQFFAMVKSGMGMSGMKVSNRVWNVQLQDKELAVWVQMEFHWKERKNGRTVPMKATSRFCDTLRMTDEGWKFSYCQELPVDEHWTFKTDK